MDPLITNGVDACLLRVLDKHGRERDTDMRRRRVPLPPAKEDEESGGENDADSPKHEVDDLA